MSKFIGQDGFYPKWTQSTGRWVHQKVPVQTGNIPLIFPPEARQYLVWVPEEEPLGEEKSAFRTKFPLPFES
jgi:hypothetical protein